VRREDGEILAVIDRSPFLISVGLNNISFVDTLINSSYNYYVIISDSLARRFRLEQVKLLTPRRLSTVTGVD
jgi:hypothetical protein